jgi:Tol biopolymer transport system component/DNA-binding winged helix-turn-helix (wHTH) protein
MAEYRAATTDPLRFGVFEIDPSARELRKHGTRVKLQDQPFAVLLILLEKPGQLVTKEVLQQRLWPADTFVEFDKGIYNAIKRLRETLGDEAETPRYIETIPKRGYRFICPLGRPTSHAALSGNTGARFGRLTARQVWFGLFAAAAVFLSVTEIWRLSREQPESSLAMEVVPLVGLAGAQSRPAFSPDGNQIAFALRNEKSSGIYSILVSGGKPLRLTSGRHDNDPRWSPNGREIAFTRPSEEGIAIYSIPALGGAERRLYSGPATAFPKTFDWSPDGKFLAISRADPDKTHARIALLSLADSETRPLTEPPEPDLDMEPAFSPDGSTVAFVRSNVGGMVSELYVVPVRGGEIKRLTFEHRTIFPSPAWTPDGTAILFSSARSGSPSLWRISASGGSAPQPVLGGSVNATNPAVSRKGNQLAYQQGFFQSEIWRLDLMGRKPRQNSPVLVVGAKGRNFRAQFSPDGKKIAFESSQSGYHEIWVCGSDGSNCGSLTSLRGIAGAPQWSPDARYIAFEYHPHSYSEIYVADVVGGPPRLVATFPGADNGGPSWSRDGKWLYFCSDQEHGRFQIYKTQVSGGPPIQVTKNGGVFGVESVDGRYFYFAKWEEPGIWRTPLSGGSGEIRVLDQPRGGTAWCLWALVNNGIYFFAPGAESEDSIQFFDFASRNKVPIVTLHQRPSDGGLAVSPDERSILFAQEKLSESQVVLVKNFR